MILPLTRVFAQNAAEKSASVALRFASGHGFGSLIAKGETWTQDMIAIQRDPSLRGRFGHSPVRPPRLFQPVAKRSKDNRHMLAEITSPSHMHWTKRATTWSLNLSGIRTKEESRTCKNTHGWRVPWRLQRLQPAVTPSVTRRLLALALAQLPRLSWNRTFLPVPPSASWAMLPIAKNSRNAASARQQPFRIQFDRLSRVTHAGAVFLHASGGCAALSQRQEERD